MVLIFTTSEEHNKIDRERNMQICVMVDLIAIPLFNEILPIEILLVMGVKINYIFEIPTHNMIRSAISEGKY